jgi:hypothetical protein
MLKNAERIAKRVTEAQEALETGFQSEAGRKRALQAIASAYDMIKNEVFAAVVEMVWNEIPGETSEAYRARGERFASLEIPDLHHVKAKHFETFAAFEGFEMVRDLIALRNAIKEAPVSPIPVKPETEKVEKVLKSVREMMESRKATFLHEVEMAHLFGGLRGVSLRTHYVHGHKGTVFLRTFWFLHGKLTPLNLLIAIAEKYERDMKGE